MAAIGLFDGLVVDVVKQRGVKKIEVGDPKKHSVGLVSVFDKGAAIRLVALIKAHGKDTLFQYGNRYYEYLWKEAGITNVTPKDLRRASAYWLANYSGMKRESLQLHLRHKNTQTTQLYYRRAKEHTENRVLDIEDDEDGTETAS